MQNYHSLTDWQVEINLLNNAATEREIITEGLHLLREVERRQIFAKAGYPSLYEYAVKFLRYSKGDAYRKIEAMKLLKEMPEVEDKIASGELCLTVVAQAQTFFKKSKSVSKEMKREVLKNLEKKSSREAERELMKLAPELAIKPQEKLKPVSPTLNELKAYFTDEQLEKLEKAKAKMKASSWAELIMKWADQTLNEPPVKASSPALGKTVRDSNKTITPKTKRFILNRDKAQCTYVSPDGTRCEAKAHLQVDHIIPASLGGDNSAQNLRALCRAHNVLAATKVYGVQKMREFVPSLRR
jgi:hypothetical protein